MNLHEYQAKDVFRSYGIPVPAGRVAASAEEAAAGARALGGAVWGGKAQGHAGGRGQAGGGVGGRSRRARRPPAAGARARRVAAPAAGGVFPPGGGLLVGAGSNIAREI